MTRMLEGFVDMLHRRANTIGGRPEQPSPLRWWAHPAAGPPPRGDDPGDRWRADQDLHRQATGDHHLGTDTRRPQRLGHLDESSVGRGVLVCVSLPYEPGGLRPPTPGDERSKRGGDNLPGQREPADASYPSGPVHRQYAKGQEHRRSEHWGGDCQESCRY